MRTLCLLLVLLQGASAACLAQGETPPAAPAGIQKLMPPKAISVIFGEYPIGPGGSSVMVHVYAVPTGKRKSDDSHQPDHPLRREDLVGPVDIPECLFTADFLQQRGADIKRLNTASFVSVDPVNSITIKWLDPKTHNSPVVAVHTGATHWLGWQLIVFPAGISNPATLQFFSYGGEADEGDVVSLDHLDRSGQMEVQDDWNKGNKNGVKRYPWDGVEFADRKSPYFVILASLKTRSEADAFCRKQTNVENSLMVRPSSHYPKLKPGFYIVLSRRFETQSDADEYAEALRKDGTKCEVRKAF